MLSLRIQRLGDATVFRCVGRITISDVGVLRIAALRQPGIRTLVLDLAEIIAVDAAGLGILVSLRAWAKESGVVLKLMNLTPRVQDLLELTNLKSAFQICSAREMLTLLCRAINEINTIRSTDSRSRRSQRCYGRNFLPADEETKLFDVLHATCACERHRTCVICQHGYQSSCV